MINLLLLSLFPAAMIIAALTDIEDFKIPNWLSATLGFTYLPTALLLGAPADLIAQSLLVGFAMLAFCFFLFAVNFFGAGDAKLLAAAAPWVGLDAIYPFLTGTILCGGFTAIFLIAFRQIPIHPVYSHAPFLMRIHQRKDQLPYAVAIAGGGLFSFSQTALFARVFT